MNSRFAVALALACAGCAALSNVSPVGDGVFMTVVRSNDVNARVAVGGTRLPLQGERLGRPTMRGRLQRLAAHVGDICTCPCTTPMTDA